MKNDNEQDNRIPSLPPELLQAYQDDELVVFIGAGISRLMGCAGWDSLADGLISAVFSPATANQILSERLSGKEKITIAHEYIKEHPDKRKAFWKEFKKALSPKKNRPDIYKRIADLKTWFLTTNCDGLLIKHFPYSYTIEFDHNEYYKHNNHREYVFCLHGNFGRGRNKDKDSLVFTTDAYLEAYQNDKPMPEFLRTVMDKKHVLFLGYGLTEFEILNSVFKPKSKDKANRHYILEGFFSYQKELQSAIKSYYSTLGITLIPYCKDNNGYDEQITIIDQWVQELSHNTSYNSKEIQDILSSLDIFNDENKHRVLRDVTREDDLKNTFIVAILNDLPRHADCFNWIEFLLQNSIFKAESIPSIERTEQGYKSVNWPIIPCILECVKKYRNTDNQGVIVQFLRECMATAGNNSEVMLNWVLIDELAEAAILSNIEPASDAELAFWEQWAQSTDTSFSVLEKTMPIVASWSDNNSIVLLSNLFAPGKSDYNRAHRAYWFERLAGLIVESASEEIITRLFYACLGFLYESEEDMRFFNCFGDRMKYHHSDYLTGIIRAMDVLVQALSVGRKKELVSDLLSGIKDTQTCQIALHIALIAQQGTASDYIINPLELEHSFPDFYLWLNMALKENLLSSADIDTIIGWIDNASFGIDLIGFDEELKATINKRINTYRYQLFKLISDYYSDHSNLPESIPESARFDMQTPLENISQYYSVIEDPKEVFFEDVDLNNLDQDDLAKALDAAVKTSRWSDSFFVRRDVYRQALQKINNDRLTVLVQAAMQWDDDKFNPMANLLSDMEVIKRFPKEDYSQYIDQLAVRIVNSTDLKQKPLLNQYLVLALRYMQDCGWDDEEVLSIILSLDFRSFDSESEDVLADMDTITSMLNVSESSLIMLSIELASRHKDNTALIDQFKSWLAKIVHDYVSVHVVLACAYNIQNIMYIDRLWAMSNIWPVFNRDEKVRIALCMCCGSSAVIPDIVNYTVSDETLGSLCARIKDDAIDNRNSGQVISYLVAAKAFGYLSEDDFRSLIEGVGNSENHHVVWASLYGVKGLNDDKKIQLLRDAFDNSKAAGIKTVYKNIVRSISSEDDITPYYWAFISECVGNMNGVYDVWETIDRCLEKTGCKNEYIPVVLSRMRDLDQLPHEYTLKRMMYHLGELNMFGEVSHLARYAVEKRISPDVFSKYDENPEDIMTDFASYRD